MKIFLNFDDVRNYNKKYFMLEEYCNNKTPELALESIYGVTGTNIFTD